MKMQKKFNGGVVKLDLEKISSIHAALSSGMRTQVGILGQKAQGRKVTVYSVDGSKAGSQKSFMTNAEIGLVHEKGSLARNIPKRSFLKWPLFYKGKDLLKIKSELWSAFSKHEISLKKAYRNLGLMAEQIVQGAFESRGFGSWEPNSDKTVAMKHSDQPLIDTGQLRRSVTSRVVGGET